VVKQSFVARQSQLDELFSFLSQALESHGSVAFVVGEAGSGKTALVTEFARQAQDAQKDLVFVIGNCNAQTGFGDPYLPFREILAQLTGDIEAKQAQGIITAENARRLRGLVRWSCDALVEFGPDLINILVPGTALIAKGGKFILEQTGWPDRFKQLVERKVAGPAVSALEQSHIFEQYTKVLKALAVKKPLVLVLDDLQWADSASISLLFHLGRRMAGSRILVLGAYRPEEVMLGRGSERHPLDKVVAEFKRYFGDVRVNLDQIQSDETRQFVNALLDLESNCLGEGFRQALLRHTGGQPLFAVELLRDMKERGYLERDAEGRWAEGVRLAWDALPPRVEGVIEERIGRLAEELRETLAVGSVEGEKFTAEVIARVQVVDEGDTVRSLNNELDRKHHLVVSDGSRRLGLQPLSSYRFRHNLLQKYLYDNLDGARKIYLHEDVGNVLETLYGDQATEIAVQLARHFQEAGIADKAVEYLRQAGERAMRLSANEEAVKYFCRGLELLKRLPDSPERTVQELQLQLPLSVALMNLKGFADPEVGQAFAHARALCVQIGETPQILVALFGLGTYYCTKADYKAAVEMAESILRIAPQAPDPSILLLIGHTGQTGNLSFLGESKQALIHARQFLDIYDPQKHDSLVFLLGQDLKSNTKSWATFDLWLRGYPDQAREMSRETLATARELAYPSSLNFAFIFANILFQFSRDVQALQELTEECLAFSKEYGAQMWIATTRIFRGWLQAEQGQSMEGSAEIQQGLVAYRATGSNCFLPYFNAIMAEALGKAGQLEEGLAMLEEGLSCVEKTGERFYEAEIHRLKGELLLAQGADKDIVEKHYKQAIEVARQLESKSLELRAVMSLSRLWQKQGKREQARKMLEEIYGWFTEGFDTADLQEAKALLEELE
jgi:predicted ATPase